MQLQLSRSNTCRPYRTSRSRRVSSKALLPTAEASSKPNAAVAMLSAAVLASAALMNPALPSAVADEAPVASSTLFAGFTDAQKQKLEAAEKSFENSDTLKQLLEKSKANKDKNKREIQNKYCYRQAELGIGDCGGLRLIPGMTKSGKQPTPEWLQKVLGVEVPEVEGQGKTLEDLLGPKAGSGQ